MKIIKTKTNSNKETKPLNIETITQCTLDCKRF